MSDPAAADVALRDARPEDVSRIATAAATCWRAAYADVLREETVDAALDAWYGGEVLRERVASDRTFLIAEAEPEARSSDLVGYAGAGREADPGGIHLGSIYVHPDRWGEGVGSALLSAFVDRCRGEGYDRVHAVALAENDRARAFYRSRGFSLREERENDLFGETVTDAEYVREI